MASRSSGSAASSQRRGTKRTKFSREDILAKLRILESLATPLPAELPLSPPPSRSTSPATGSKRKARNAPRESNNHKRARVDLSSKDDLRVASLRASSSAVGHRHPSYSTVEDGEVREDYSHQTSAVAPSPTPVPPPEVSPLSAWASAENLPVRRQKHGPWTTEQAQELQRKYHQKGRQFKFSAERRKLGTLLPSQDGFKPLENPPKHGSPYHQEGPIMCALEALDAAVYFSYSSFALNQGASVLLGCVTYLNWALSLHSQLRGSSEARSALYGVAIMLRCYLLARVRYSAHKDPAFEVAYRQLITDAKEDVAKAVHNAENGHIPAGVPPKGGMLASPASVPSANSTPSNQGEEDSKAKASANNNANMDVDSVMARSFGRRHLHKDWLPAATQTQVMNNKLPSNVAKGINEVRVGVELPLLRELHEMVEIGEKLKGMTKEMQHFLNMPIVAKHYPRTFARMVHSTLQYHDEHEPELEDMEGELMWPPHFESGYGLGWACLMARSMIEEYGHTIGYQGAGGLIVDTRVKR